MKKPIFAVLLILCYFYTFYLKVNACNGNYDYILFDLDRTLLDFDASEKHALDKIYAQYFSDLPKTKFMDIFHEINTNCWKIFEIGKYTLSDVRNKRFQILLTRLKIQNLDPHKIEKDYELYLAEKADWLPETKEHFLKIAENYNTAIITNGYQLVQGARIKNSGIEDVVDHIFTSESIGHSKPSPLYFKYVFGKMKIHPQGIKILIVGDSLSSDYQSALNIKADFCWVNQKAQPLPIKYPVPNCIVKDIKELHGLIAKSANTNLNR